MLTDWLQQFQALLVGVIGFSGVCVTIWFNAKQSRIERSENMCIERRVLRIALLEELQQNREIVSQAMQLRKSIRSESRVYGVPQVIFDDIYKQAIARLGLLSRGEVRKILHAYLRLRTGLMALDAIPDKYRVSDGFYEVPETIGSEFSTLFKNNIKAMEAAIGNLSSALESDADDSSHGI